jgi:hypothetical protein
MWTWTGPTMSHLSASDSSPAKMAAGSGEQLILASQYMPVAESHYLRDPLVGAKIDGNAIRTAMQTVLSEGVGMFHVHRHEHRGRPQFSRTDVQGLPPLIRSFQSVGSAYAHGALLLSHDSLDCLVWLPGDNWPSPGGRITVVGRPMELEDSGGWYA